MLTLSSWWCTHYIKALILVLLARNWAKQILQSYLLMASTSCEPGKVILMSIWVPIMRFKRASKYSRISAGLICGFCFRPYLEHMYGNYIFGKITAWPSQSWCKKENTDTSFKLGWIYYFHSCPQVKHFILWSSNRHCFR